MREFDEADIQAIMGVVEELALDAADGDTSIPQEKLARILAAVRYCVDEGAACRGRADAEGLARCVGADELYRIGYRSIVDKTACALHRYNEMSPVFDDYGMEGLGRTFRDEILAELARFDPRFEPDAEVVFGYPMPQDDGTLLGDRCYSCGYRPHRFRAGRMCVDVRGNGAHGGDESGAPGRESV